MYKLKLILSWQFTNARVLIDVGAILANADMVAVCDFLVKGGQEVVSYRRVDGSWATVHTNGDSSRKTLPDKEMFVVYDESSCIGVDKKLHPDALAMLVVSSGCTMTKLMQAAGRMRQLSMGQSLQMVLTTHW